MPKEGEKYQANRNNNGEASDSSKKAAKVAAKGAADYFTGGKGGAIVDKLADTKLGDAVLNNVGKKIDKVPGLNKAAESLDNKGALDVADKGLSMAESGGKASTGNTQGAGGSNFLPKNSSNKNKKSSELNDADLEDADYKENDESFTSKLFGQTEGGSTFDLMKMIGFFSGPGLPIFAVAVIVILIFFVGAYLAMLANIDEDDNNKTNLSSDSSCVYSIKGFSNGSTTVKRDINISNLKVRLMECDGSKPVSGEDLIDFEKYIIGVTYQENGNGSDAAIKTQAVAARSYAISRPAMMGNSGGTKLFEENGTWILQLRACTNDQAYCDPDKGCWSNRSGGEGATIHSGQNSSAAWTRGPLSENDRIRTLVAATAGEVLVNSKGYILNTSYLNTDQQRWNSNYPGLDYKQILLSYYNKERNIGASDIVKMSCTSSSKSKTATGPYANWKQYDSKWGNISLGNSSKTIRSSGCLVTSVSMLIAKSGVPTNVNGQFNPGTFVQKLNSSGGFVGADFVWASVSSIAPKFVFQNKINISGLSREQKLAKIKELLDSGYYVVAEVKGKTGQHWVAIDSVNGSNVKMMDPGSSSTDLWKQYNYINTSQLAYYKVV